jgi:uncharacterized repeat protein (TIGR01451 family)
MPRRKHPFLLIAAIALLAGLPLLAPQSAAAAGTADLSVTMTGDAKSLKFGKTMTLTVTLTNKGPDVATGVEVGLGTSDSFANFGGTCPDGSISSICAIGEMAAGASVTLQFQVGACCRCCPEFLGVAVASVSHDANTVDPESANDLSRIEVKLKGKPPF